MGGDWGLTAVGGRARAAMLLSVPTGHITPWGMDSKDGAVNMSDTISEVKSSQGAHLFHCAC